MRLNIESWKYFKINNLFDVFTGGDLILGDIEQGNIPIASNSSENNNIVAYTAEIPNRKLFNHKISISISDRGKFWAFIQPKDFYIGTRAKTLVSKNKNITLNQLAFITTIINRESFKFCYGRNCCDNLTDILIKLPVKTDDNGTNHIDAKKEFSKEGYVPDWQFMENYINSLHYKRISSKNLKNKVTTINPHYWKEFKIGAYFNVYTGGDMWLEDEQTGNIPVICLGGENNGVCGYISKNPEHPLYPANSISVAGWAGGLFAFYQSKEFYVKGRLKILVPKNNFKNNKYISLFLCTLLNQEEYRYTYGRKASGDHVSETILKLPAILNSQSNKYEPDWEYMENYIKSLPYGDRI
jgi:hypothetical protein